MEQKIINIIAHQAFVREELVVPTATLEEDLSLDSLDRVELTMALEEEFSLEIPDEEAEKIKTVGDVIAYIKAKKG